MRILLRLCSKSRQATHLAVAATLVLLGLSIAVLDGRLVAQESLPPLELPLLAQRSGLPAPTGPFAVGRTTFDWVDPTRRETFSSDPDDVRELVAWVWYPAIPQPDAGRAAYLPGAWADEVERLRTFDPNEVATAAVAEAPLADARDRFPVLVFSPGNSSYPANYTALAQEFASHGYVVVVIGHPSNGSVTVFADGRVVPGDPGAQIPPGRLDIQTRAGTRIVEVQAADVRFVLDELERLDANLGPFGGRLDLSRVGILGHSLGGATAAAACRVDLRCAAGANLDGGLWGTVAEAGVPVPFMQIQSDHPPCDEREDLGPGAVDHCQEVERRFVDGWKRIDWVARPAYWLELLGSRHADFSDTPFLPLPPARREAVMAEATIAPERAWRATSDYLLAFFEAHLGTGDPPLLDGPSPSYPEVHWV